MYLGCGVLLEEERATGLCGEGHHLTRRLTQTIDVPCAGLVAVAVDSISFLPQFRDEETGTGLGDAQLAGNLLDRQILAGFKQSDELVLLGQARGSGRVGHSVLRVVNGVTGRRVPLPSDSEYAQVLSGRQHLFWRYINFTVSTS